MEPADRDFTGWGVRTCDLFGGLTMRANGSNTMDILERLRERHLDPDAGNPSTADYAFLLGIAMALAKTLSDKEKVEGKST